jgi:hypothetical protein
MNRRSIVWLAAALFPALPGLAQPLRQATQPRNEPGLYEFKHLDKESAEAVAHLASILFRVTVDYTPPIHLAIIRPMGNAVPDWQQKALDFLKRYDVPPPPEPQVHYVAYLIRASNAKSAADGEHLNPIPKALDDAIAEMKSSLIYTRYDLLTTVTNVSQGAASASDSIPFNQNFGYSYTIEYENVTVAPDHKSVSVRPFRFILHHLGNNSQSSISSTITVRDGQKLVLGKVRMTDDADVFVVLTVKAE